MIEYDTFKIKIFELIQWTSMSYIVPRLKKLSKDFNIPYEVVVDDFNEYTYEYYKEAFQTYRKEL